MKTYQLYVIIGGERLSKTEDAEVRGIVKAEEKAKELFDKYYPECPSDDTYVACVEHEYDMRYGDFLVWSKDCMGDCYWRMMRVGQWCNIGFRLLNDFERDELEKLRNEKEKHVSDLNEDELKWLYDNVVVGSSFLSDYENSFEIDPKEVSDVFDSYLEYVGDDESVGSAEDFASFCLCMLVE